MANGVYEKVDKCVSCACNRNCNRQKSPLQLFPSSEPLDFVGMDILGLLLKTASRNQYAVVITDCYLKRTRAISSSKTTSTHLANIFLDQWIIAYSIPSFILSDNGSQLLFKFFETLRGLLGAKQITTTAYHPETNGQVERFHRTMVTQLSHNVTEQQHNWD